MIVNILLLILIILRLVIGIRLVILARQNKLPNIYWLAVLFLTHGVGLLFTPAPGNPLINFPFSLWIFTLVSQFAPQIYVIDFNHTTFYQGRKSPLLWFVGAYVVFVLIGLYILINLKSGGDPTPLLALTNIMATVVWSWHARSAALVLTGLSTEKAVEPWIKARYRLIIAYSIAMAISAGGSLLRTFLAGADATSLVGNIMAIISLIAQIVAVSLQFLTWVMPENFRMWLNREQRAQETSQQLGMISILGAAMMTNTDLKDLACLYAIRTTIGKRIGTEDSAVIRGYIDTMSYTEWNAILQHAELRRILVNSGADNTIAVKAIENAQNALVEKQSLLTFGAR
jgi:hypothetical protein